MLGRLLGKRTGEDATIAAAADSSNRPPSGLSADAVARRGAMPSGVVIRRGTWLPALSGRLSGMDRSAAAVTLGRTIVVHPSIDLSPRLLRHELAHVRQWTRQPLTFPVRYLLAHLRHGYRNNPFEVEARQAE